MKQDPFYKKIIEGLNGSLDGNTFESCVRDLIDQSTTAFTIAAVSGGSDEGMDGSVLGREGIAFPLVTTVGEKVLANMKRNLNTYISKGHAGRKVIVATSQSLSAKRKGNLRDEAAKLGFSIVEIYDQETIATYLHRNPNWCKALLGLTGEPSALSVIPQTRRPILNGDYIGEDAIAWLKETYQDKLVVGQPGAGKTSLFVELTRDENQRAFFVVSKNRTEISNALRELNPRYVILDDAHNDPDFLRDLVHLRNQLGSEFKIIASSWPKAQSKLPEWPGADHVYSLQRVTQNQMVLIIENAGIRGVDWLIQEIIHQSEGLPGLATTLSKAALRYGVEKINSADMLFETFTNDIFDQMDLEIKQFLGCFSLGGESGMQKELVRRTLQLRPLEFTKSLSQLDAAGIVYEMGDDAIVVRPPALRHALIKYAFFSRTGLSSQILNGLIEGSSFQEEIIHELISVRVRGGLVTSSFLSTLISKFPWNAELFGRFAGLGINEANWVINHFDSPISAIPSFLLQSGLLRYIPDQTVSQLLTESIGDNRQLHSHPTHPQRILRDWAHGLYPNQPETLSRRKTLFDATIEWISETKDISVGLLSIASAMSPKFEVVRIKPGYMAPMILSGGYLTNGEFEELQKLWPDVLATIDAASRPINWKPILDLVDEYMYFDVTVEQPDLKQKHQLFAKQMIVDLSSRMSGHIGWMHSLYTKASMQEWHTEIVIDPLVLALYPLWNVDESYLERLRYLENIVDELAQEAATKTSDEILTRVAEIEKSMSEIGEHYYPRLTHRYCEQLAKQVKDVVNWADCAIKLDLQSILAAPFIEVAAKQNANAWEELIMRCFQVEKLESTAMVIVLSLENPSQIMLDTATPLASHYIRQVEYLWRQRKLSPALSLRFLQEIPSELSSSLAIVEWQTIPFGLVQPDLLEAWKQAILYTEGGYYDHDLARIFDKNPQLGYEWLMLRLGDADHFRDFEYEHALGSIVKHLNIEQRQSIIDKIPKTFRNKLLVSKIVGLDQEVFEHLLQNETLAELHLVSLYNPSDILSERWQQLATIALRKGKEPEQIVVYTVHNFAEVEAWSGKESLRWEGRLKSFQELPDNNQIKLIKQAGINYCEKKLQKLRVSEHNEEVFGDRFY